MCKWRDVIVKCVHSSNNKHMAFTLKVKMLSFPVSHNTPTTSASFVMCVQETASGDCGVNGERREAYMCWKVPRANSGPSSHSLMTLWLPSQPSKSMTEMGTHCFVCLQRTWFSIPWNTHLSCLLCEGESWPADGICLHTHTHSCHYWRCAPVFPFQAELGDRV